MTPEAAIVLCAGLGTRLSPLTDVVPKPLLHFVDRPIVSYTVAALRALGVRRIGINVHHREGAFRAWAAEQEAAWAELGSDERPELVVAGEPELLGTGGGVRNVWEALGRPEGPIPVINGDVVAAHDLGHLLRVHRRTSAVATMMMLASVPGETAVWLDERRSFVAELPGPDEAHRSPRYGSQEPATFGGVSILESRLIAQLPADNACVVRHGIGPALARGSVVAASGHEGFWADLGTPRRFAEATRLVLSRPELLGSLWPHGGADALGRWVSAPGALGSGAQVEATAYVSPLAEVGAGAFIGAGCVVGAGCAIAPGARIEESVLSHGAQAHGIVRQRILVADRGVRWG